MPAVIIIIPYLFNLCYLTQFAGTNNIAHLKLYWITNPLRSHLYNLSGFKNSLPCQFSIVNINGHWFFTITIFTCVNDLN